MINKVSLIGRTGKDPEVTALRDGVKVARISLATSEAYTDKQGEKKENTEWHNLVFWRGLAEIAEKYIAKGQLLYVEGKIHYSTYDDKEGKKQHRTEIIVDRLKMLGGRSEKSEQSQEQPAQNDSDFTPTNDDLPF